MPKFWRPCGLPGGYKDTRSGRKFGICTGLKCQNFRNNFSQNTGREKKGSSCIAFEYSETPRVFDVLAELARHGWHVEPAIVLFVYVRRISDLSKTFTVHTHTHAHRHIAGSAEGPPSTWVLPCVHLEV